MTEPLRIGNASGFYGDRFGACGRCSGRQLDLMTGDYLAELTMLILGRDRLRDPRTGLGYARSVLRQLEQCLGTAWTRHRASSPTPASRRPGVGDDGDALVHRGAQALLQLA